MWVLGAEPEAFPRAPSALTTEPSLQGLPSDLLKLLCVFLCQDEVAWKQRCLVNVLVVVVIISC